MKKAYSKPQIYFESFSLSQSIAAGCDVIISFTECGMDFSGLMVFLEGMTGCANIQVDNIGGDGEFNGICYHTYQGNDTLFNS